MLITFAMDDALLLAETAPEALEQVLQPKELKFLFGGHFYVYAGESFKGIAKRQVESLSEC